MDSCKKGDVFIYFIITNLHYHLFLWGWIQKYTSVCLQSRRLLSHLSVTALLLKELKSSLLRLRIWELSCTHRDGLLPKKLAPPPQSVQLSPILTPHHLNPSLLSYCLCSSRLLSPAGSLSVRQSVMMWKRRLSLWETPTTSCLSNRTPLMFLMVLWSCQMPVWNLEVTVKPRRSYLAARRRRWRRGQQSIFWDNWRLWSLDKVKLYVKLMGFSLAFTTELILMLES